MKFEEIETVYRIIKNILDHYTHVKSIKYYKKVLIVEKYGEFVYTEKIPDKLERYCNTINDVNTLKEMNFEYRHVRMKNEKMLQIGGFAK